MTWTSSGSSTIAAAADRTSSRAGWSIDRTASPCRSERCRFAVPPVYVANRGGGGAALPRIVLHPVAEADPRYAVGEEPLDRHPAIGLLLVAVVARERRAGSSPFRRGEAPHAPGVFFLIAPPGNGEIDRRLVAPTLVRRRLSVAPVDPHADLENDRPRRDRVAMFAT